jgi:hypothetical protein
LAFLKRDGGAIGQCHDGADAGDRHQALADLIVPDNGQQTAMQYADLFAHHLPDQEHPKSSAIHKYAGRLPHLMALSGRQR